MAVKKKVIKAAAAAAATAASSDLPEHLKVNLDDQNALRCHLDEAAAEVIRQSGYKEHFTVTYVKIALGLCAIGLALYAQFGPGKFPDSWWTVFSCVIGYLVATTTLNVYCYLCEKDNFLICLPPPQDSGPRTKLYVSSHMERYSDVYQLRLRSAVAGDTDRDVKLEGSVVQYFHSNGYFAEEVFKNDVLRVLGDYQQLKTAITSSKKVR